MPARLVIGPWPGSTFVFGPAAAMSVSNAASMPFSDPPLLRSMLGKPTER